MGLTKKQYKWYLVTAAEIAKMYGKTEHNDGLTTARAHQMGVQKVNLTNKSRHHNFTLYIGGDVIMTAFSRPL